MRREIARLAFRTGNADDVAFLFRRSLEDLRRADRYRYCADEIFYPYMHRALEHTFTRCLIRVAYPDAHESNGMVVSAEPRFIAGFIVCDITTIGLVIHYLYTRRDVDTTAKSKMTNDYRRRGIATALVKNVMQDYDLKSPIIYTQRTQKFRNDFKFADYVDRRKDIVYHPFLFETLLPHNWETGIVSTLDSEFKDELARAQWHNTAIPDFK